MQTWADYTDKGPALLAALETAGIIFFTLDGAVHVSDLERARSIAATVDPLPFEQVRKVAEVKASCEDRILNAYPLWRQVNGSRENPASPETAAMFARIDALREASNLIEADVMSLTDWRAVRDFDVSTSSRWPD
ncbi:MAG TPA: hypothetical protein VIG90_09620 [Pedomonas sp.]|uniref:hypothetical protein n=1 Tax=Pedomonas sp. TaxID=2976421 RepID=UPI002F41FBD1